jgi:hypothetical protein
VRAAFVLKITIAIASHTTKGDIRCGRASNE